MENVRFFLKQSLVVVFAVLLFNQSKAQLVIDTNVLDLQLAQDIVGQNVVVLNTDINCHPMSYGQFFEGNSNIGISNGLVLTTGVATEIANPASFNFSTNMDYPGMPELSNIVGLNTNDACYVSVDFVAATDTVAIRYRFGSQEYPDWVNSTFNDVFAIFLSGPDPNGGLYIDSNIALIPGTNIPVTINTVNNGTANSGPCVNCQYYVNNQDTASPTNNTIALNGLTTILDATAYVVPLDTYRITIAVADVADGIYDSGVFVEQMNAYSGTFFFLAFGSLLPGAELKFKKAGSDDYLIKTFTDEKGMVSDSRLYHLIQIGDTLSIDAPGYVPVTIVADEYIVENKRVDIAMFESLTPSDKILKPALSIVDEVLVTSNQHVTLKATAENVLNYELNLPLYQSKNFVPLTLNNDQFNVLLNVGYNQILVRYSNATDTVILEKEVFYYPPGIIGQSAYPVYMISDSVSAGADIYVNGQFLKTLQAGFDTFWLPKGGKNLEFFKDGYANLLEYVSDTSTIDLSNQFTELSLSSDTDSAIINFEDHDPVGYWKNISLYDKNQSTVVALKQYEQGFESKALIPESRRFDISLMNSPVDAELNFKAILAQTENLDTDSIYLLSILDNDVYQKISFDNPLVNYEPEFQKLHIENIHFDHLNATQESYVIMKKQPPVAVSTSLQLAANDSLVIYKNELFAHPDSLKSEIQIWLGNVPAELDIKIEGDQLVINAIECTPGELDFVLYTSHDWLETAHTISVNVLADFELAEMIEKVSCYGNADGSIAIVTTGGTEPYEIEWSNQMSGAMVSDLQAGSYTVTITDDDGCYYVQTFEIDEPEQINTNTGSNPATASQNNGKAWVEVTGGIEPYLFEWNDENNQQTDTAFNLVSGNYMVTVTDANGCSEEINVFVDQSTGMDEASLAQQLMIYPNPNTGKFFVELELNEVADVQLSVFNTAGQVVYAYESYATGQSFTHELDLSAYQGVFIIRLTSGEKTLIDKVVVQ